MADGHVKGIRLPGTAKTEEEVDVEEQKCRFHTFRSATGLAFQQEHAVTAAA